MSAKKTIIEILEGGYDVSRADFHIYKRGTFVSVVKFPKMGMTPEIDETFDNINDAVSRYLELVPPAGK